MYTWENDVLPEENVTFCAQKDVHSQTNLCNHKLKTDVYSYYFYLENNFILQLDARTCYMGNALDLRTFDYILLQYLILKKLLELSR